MAQDRAKSTSIRAIMNRRALVLTSALVIAAAVGVGWSTASAQTQSQLPATPIETAPSEPEWKTSPFHGVTGGDGNIIPCRCLYRGTAYGLGAKVCMTTHLGTVMTECDLQQNNTSWVPTVEACTVS
jgi:hypothetical protein